MGLLKQYRHTQRLFSSLNCKDLVDHQQAGLLSSYNLQPHQSASALCQTTGAQNPLMPSGCAMWYLCLLCCVLSYADWTNCLLAFSEHMLGRGSLHIAAHPEYYVACICCSSKLLIALHSSAETADILNPIMRPTNNWQGQLVV